ncbi:hypothetical protein [Marinibacterium profundimaris]|uniref:Glucose-inhibited division protein A n=1 Tax=Marinibacterium profundimaris TaxID=1679460 RepID=A0A225NVL2_9RHOB|nr:hypothetical protein [Marinibacterium profundimaris]OWU77457.1 glucose-inhibited division protein A [Marinibacterium profundimaris]
MLYLLAILLPPLAIFLSGWIITSFIVLIIWIPAIILSGGLTHPMFIILAWLMIHQSKVQREG